MTAAHKRDLALTLSTPLGQMTLAEEKGAITALYWGDPERRRITGRSVNTFHGDPPPLLSRAALLLERYFAGEQEPFDLPLEPSGTAFERLVWQVLRTIPWGETRTYGEVARQSGGSPRAVGRAAGRNPIPIIIPCHRVVAASGLGGFSAPGGGTTKRALLALEGNWHADDLFAGGSGRLARESKWGPTA